MDNYAFEGEITRVSPIGLVAEGLRVNLGFGGPVTEGPLAGDTLEGTCYLLIRPDGAGVVDARELVSGADGPVASIRAEGYVVPPFEMPELATLADPSFTWPDLDLPMHGWTRVQAGRPLGDANRSVYGFTGTVNMGTGVIAVRAERIGKSAERAAVDRLSGGYAAFAAGDIATVLELFSPSISWHEPGQNPIAGDYKGVEEVAGFFGALAERSGGTFHLEVHEITARGDRVLARVTEGGTRPDGRSLAVSAIHAWREVDGRTVEFQNHYADQAAVDRFWSDRP